MFEVGFKMRESAILFQYPTWDRSLHLRLLKGCQICAMTFICVVFTVFAVFFFCLSDIFGDINTFLENVEDYGESATSFIFAPLFLIAFILMTASYIFMAV